MKEYENEGRDWEIYAMQKSQDSECRTIRRNNYAMRKYNFLVRDQGAGSSNLLTPTSFEGIDGVEIPQIYPKYFKKVYVTLVI